MEITQKFPVIIIIMHLDLKADAETSELSPMLSKLQILGLYKVSLNMSSHKHSSLCVSCKLFKKRIFYQAMWIFSYFSVEALCERAKEKSLTVSEKCLWNIYTVLDIKSEERERLRNSLMQDEMNFFEPAIKLCEYREDFSLLDRIKDAVWSSSNGVNLERKKARIITAEIRLCSKSNVLVIEKLLEFWK